MRFDGLPAVEVFPGHVGQFLESDRMTFVRWRIKEGAALPEHSHEHEQVVHVLSGEYRLKVDAQEYPLKAGDIFVIGSNKLHSGIAASACEILDTFAPKRADYTRYAKKQ